MTIVVSFGCPVQPLFWTIENEFEILDTFSCTLTQQGRFRDVFLKQGILKMIIRNDLKNKLIKLTIFYHFKFNAK